MPHRRDRLLGLNLRLVERLQHSLDLDIAFGDFCLMKVPQLQRLLEGKDVFAAVVPRQCFANRLSRGATANIAVRGQLLGSMSASDDCSNNAQARCSGDVRNDMVKLHVHLHESLLHMLYMGGRVFDHPFSMTQICPQLSDGGAGAKASAKKSVLVKLLQPLSIVDVGLSSRHVLYVPSVHQKDLKASSFENLED